MNERLKFKGRRAEKALQAKALKTRIAGLVYSLREALDPFDPPEELPGDIIAAQALELSEAVGELKTVLAEIEAIEKVLGR